MRILTIGSDRKLFEEKSKVRKRALEYGALFDELHIIIFSCKNHVLKKQQIADNIWLYPTDSMSRGLYIIDALRIGKSVKNVDIVTTQDPFEAGLSGFKLAKALSARLHVQIHTDFLSPYFVRHSPLNWIRVKISRFVIPKAHCIRVVSKRIKQSIKDQFNLSVEPVVLPIFALVTEIVESKPKKDIRKKYSQFDFLILMASRFEREKNISLAIYAMEKVIKQYPKAGLLIVGEGREKNKIQKLVLKLKLSGSVMFERWSKDIVPYYKTADVFLNTSNYEGYGLTLIEAASAGCPIITTDVGIIGDVLTESDVLICPVGDRACIERSIVRMIEDINLRNKLAKRAQSAVQKNVIAQKEIYLQKYKESFEACFRER